jgi:hypothetical protein
MSNKLFKIVNIGFVCMAFVACTSKSKQLNIKEYAGWCGSGEMRQKFQFSKAFNSQVTLEVITPFCKVVKGLQNPTMEVLKKTLKEESNYVQFYIKIPKGTTINEEHFSSILINDQYKANSSFLFKEESFLADTAQTYIAEFESPVVFNDIFRINGNLKTEQGVCEFLFDSLFFNNIPSLIIQ